MKIIYAWSENVLTKHVHFLYVLLKKIIKKAENKINSVHERK